MAKNKGTDFAVIFAGLREGEQAPHFAVYELDSAARAVRKLGVCDGKVLHVDLGGAESVALGPEVEDFKALPRESLTKYRAAQASRLWKAQGIVVPRDIWERFLLRFICVTGTVRKCRPWFWELIEGTRTSPPVGLTPLAHIKPITADLHPHLLFPVSCVPVCDGIVEIYERECCCHHISIPDLLERLHDILDHLPIPIPDPIPGPDPGPLTPQSLRTKARKIQRRRTPGDPNAIPPENLLRDYLALRTMPADAARLYVLERPHLFPFCCRCSVRKVGETMLQPGGNFDFCYLRIPLYGHRHTTYAYKVKQLIDGVWTVVYDGLSAHQYFSADGPAEIRSYNSRARVCAEGPGEPPPNDDAPFVMLQHVGAYGSFHHNFPGQTGESRVGQVNGSHGTFTTSYAPDCPWGGALGLYLWFSPELEPTVKYYRLKVVAVDDAGSPVGTPVVLNSTVTWDKFVTIPGDVVLAPETLGPVTEFAEKDLFRVPYWKSPDHRYLSGQFHQVWNTAQDRFPDGKYLLLVEVFDEKGSRIKPSGAVGTGAEKNFQFRRWTSAADTAPVPFSDAAHVFWVDNTAVVADIVDLRKNGSVNTAECQFMADTADSAFAIGFRAFHVHGVAHAGSGDDNSFMWNYDIGWQRGLNGGGGSLGPAPLEGDNHTDVGETGNAEISGSETFRTMLTKTFPDGSTVVLSKCTFSVTLRVRAKHFTGSGRIQAYDRWETASFALEIIS